MRMSPFLWVLMWIYFGSFLPLVLGMSSLKGMPLNMNIVQGRSFDTIIGCLKAMSIAPYSSNKLKFLNYNKIKVQYVSFLPITFNNDIIFEFSPICLPISHSEQMQSMDHKYNDDVWCKVKTSNIKNNFGLGFRSTRCLGQLRYINNFYEHFLRFVVHNEVSWSMILLKFPQLAILHQVLLFV